MISVCIATYNGALYISELLNSILPQLCNADEVIISDDNSSDSTIAIIENFSDKRIKIFKNTHQNNVNANFNNALSHSSGDIIFLADQDDVWLPGKVAICVQALSNCDCVIHDAVVTDSNLNPIHDSFFSLRNSRPGFYNNLIANSYLGCCMAFKRAVLKKAMPIPITNRFYHDNWIGSVADVFFDVKFIPFKGILFRRHNNNTSSTATKSKNNFLKKVSNRISLLYRIIGLYFNENLSNNRNL